MDARPAPRIITMDASGWTSRDDFYDALLPALGAPDWHGRNLDALYDSIGSGGINQVEPPFRVRINGWIPSPAMTELLEKVRQVFDDAHVELGQDVSILFDPPL